MRRGTRPCVLMTADAVGGVWTYALDLSSGLLAAGVEVVLAVLGPAPSPGQAAAARALGVTPLETGLPLDWLAEEGDDLARAAGGVARLAASVGADLVHLNTPALAGAAAFGRPVVGACHSCLATWWEAVRGGPAPADFLWRTAALKRGYEACDALIAPSAAFAAATLRVYGREPQTVRNGRRPDGRRRTPGDKAAHVLTSGRLWDEGKNIAGLDAAAAQMSGAVYAAGPLEGPQGRGPVTLRAVRALGVLDPAAMTDRLNTAGAFVSLARYEPFGLGVLEAAQAGCALLLSDIPTFRELWSGAALFTAPDDPPAAARRLDALLGDQGALARLGREAAARAGLYTCEAMTAETLRVYAARSPAFRAAEAAA